MGGGGGGLGAPPPDPDAPPLCSELAANVNRTKTDTPIMARKPHPFASHPFASHLSFVLPYDWHMSSVLVPSVAGQANANGNGICFLNLHKARKPHTCSGRADMSHRTLQNTLRNKTMVMARPSPVVSLQQLNRWCSRCPL